VVIIKAVMKWSMTMKKTVSILLAAALFLGGLAGCGGGEAEGAGSTVLLPAADAQRTSMEQAGERRILRSLLRGGLI
jgi:hypothetical protein